MFVLFGLVTDIAIYVSNKNLNENKKIPNNLKLFVQKMIATASSV